MMDPESVEKLFVTRKQRLIGYRYPRVCLPSNQYRAVWFQSNSLSLVVEVHAGVSVRQD